MKRFTLINCYVNIISALSHCEWSFARSWSENSNNSVVTVNDWFSNEIVLPSASAFSLIFSTISMIKAVVDLNITGVHACRHK